MRSHENQPHQTYNFALDDKWLPNVKAGIAWAEHGGGDSPRDPGLRLEAAGRIVGLTVL